MDIDLIGLDKALDRSLEAALDIKLWPEILNDIAAATNSYGANIIPAAERARALVVTTDSIAPAFEDYFNDGWYENEWRLRALPLLARNGTACDQQYTSRDDFEKHGYYKFHAKYGIGRSCMVGFSSQDDLLCLTLHRKLSQNFFDEEETAVLKVMRDRLNVSVTMMRHLSQTRVTGMSDAFEMVGTAAIFFNRFSKVTHVNTTAAKLLGRELQVVRGEMRSINREETARIRERMKSVISERWLQPGPDAGPLTVRREGRRPIVMRIQRLGGNLPDFFAHSVGVCLLEDAEVIQPTATQTLRQLFGLTPTEARLVASLSEGLSLKEIAERSFQSYQTVRTHLKSIFSKTETGRQAELVALVARLKAARQISGE